ncbi:MAG: adenylate cyclase [Saprospiraceae bacterium]|jgi:adenylate cyclase
MGKEIERKFLLKNEEWKGHVSENYLIKQGYLNSNPDRAVRVRVLKDKGILTIKSKTVGISRLEFEYEIPLSDANELIELCEKPLIEKVRNIVVIDSQIWEIDEFSGGNKGLVLAEIELESESTKVNLPSWIGTEVSHDTRYFNSNLFTNSLKG